MMWVFSSRGVYAQARAHITFSCDGTLFSPSLCGHRFVWSHESTAGARAMSGEDNLIELTIDGMTARVPPGTTILQVRRASLCFSVGNTDSQDAVACAWRRQVRGVCVCAFCLSLRAS